MVDAASDPPGTDRILAVDAIAATAVVPSEPAAAALVIMDHLMMTQVKNIPWDDVECGIPAFAAHLLLRQFADRALLTG